PARTDWISATAAAAIRDSMLRLRRVHAWLTLLSPPGMRPPYTFAIRRARDRAVVTDNVLIGGERYGLSLQPRSSVASAASPRYVYVFSIDSYGRSVLVYPVNTGSVENRIAVPLTDMQLGKAELFRTVEPYGVDTYFLLTSEEALPNPSIFNFDGVKTLEVRGETPLEQLLIGIGDPTRGMRVIPTPPEWSIERIAFESMPGSVQ
ncbi:MAG TPA: hypothetical protein VJ901_22235, partial [Thermoanaerobaculia bacterium]|nr:hypothetical protein [Thermoanaerobaculia bacterium]